METIGERLEKLRLLKNLTLQEVAEVLGTSKGNISNYETNKIKPASDSIIQLSKLFNVSTDYILTGANYIDMNNTISSNYSNRSSFNEDELYIIHLFRKLNDRNKIKLEEYIENKIIEQRQNKYTTNTKILHETTIPL